MPNGQHKAYSITNGGKSVELYIYDTIGEGFFEDGVTAQKVAKDLEGMKGVKQIDVFINSAGGSVFDGMAIYNVLHRHSANATVFIDGAALSIASVIAMAGDTIRMAENALMMIHEPLAGTWGTADDHRKQIKMLDKTLETIVATYAARTGKDEQVIRDAMAEETWFTAAEAKEWGLVDEVTPAKKMAAAFDPAACKFKNVPRNIADLLSDSLEPKKGNTMPDDQNAATPPKLPDESKPATVKELKAACPGASSDFICGQMETGATVDEAKTAFIAEQQQAVDAAKKETSEAQATAKKAKEDAAAAAKKPGVEALGGGGSGKSAGGGEGEPTAEAYDEAVQKLRDRGMNRHQACAQVARRRPDLQKAYLQATNVGRRRQNLIEDKFDQD